MSLIGYIIPDKADIDKNF